MNAPPMSAPAGARRRVLGHLLLPVAVITLAGRAAGAFAERWLRQPSVIGEIGLGLLVALLSLIRPASKVREARAWLA